jgi:hypothetical protein
MFPVLDGRNHGEVVALENSGHMGFIEEKEKSVQVIRKFLEKVY